MTTTVRALCHGCGQQRGVTVAGVFRRHRRGAATCPGAGEPPREAVTPPVSRAGSPSGLLAVPAPTEPSYGRSCDAGHCDRPSVGWRLFRTDREWLPVCGLHMDGPAGRNRIYDPEDG